MQWITITTSKEEVSERSAKTLTVSDLKVLCDPKAWMTDALINYGVKAYGNPVSDYGDSPIGWMTDALINYGVKAYGNPPFDYLDPPLDNVHNNVLWIEPAVVKLGKDGDAQAFDNSLGRNGVLGDPALLDKAKNLPWGANVILFPVNTGDRHWSLLAFFKDDCTFVHYDSLQTTNDPAAKALIIKLCDKGYLSQQFKCTSPAEIVRQKDGYNCGVYLVSFARMIMESGTKPDGKALAAVTSKSCDDLREDMLRSMQPLVAQDLGVYDNKPKSLDEKEDSKEARQVAVKKLQVHLAKENPVQIASHSAKPTTIVVVLTSDNPKIQDLTSARVVFTINKKSFWRQATKDGRTWRTGINLQITESVQVTVTGSVTPGPEFVKQEQVTTLTVNVGDEKEVTLKFTPKKPRRIYAKFLFADDLFLFNKISKPSDGLFHPFPEGFDVDCLFDDGPHQATATLRKDGLCLSKEDSKPGVRVPYRYSKVCLSFSKRSQEMVFRWNKGEDESTKLVNKPAKPDKLPPTKGDMVHSDTLPNRQWGPTPTEDWELPKEHKVASAFQKHIDLSKVAGEIGTEEEPLTYRMLRMPKLWMNKQRIEHVVVLMLENRGFDHFMGYLYDKNTRPKNSYPPRDEAQGDHIGLRVFEGVEGITNGKNEYEGEYPEKGKKVKIQGAVEPIKGARACNIPRTNSHEDFVHIFQQMYGKDVVPNYKDMETSKTRDCLVKKGKAYIKPTMTGFAHNFCDGILHHRGKTTKLTKDLISEILEIYLPDQLPVLSGLARHYAVSDLWFCSVPSQTNTNRAYWAAGTAAGLVTNDFYPTFPKLDKVKHLASDTLPTGKDHNGIPHDRTLFDVLEERKIGWKYYWSMHYPFKPYLYFTNMFSHMGDEKYNDHLSGINNFYRDAKNGDLPPVTYIEPHWGGGTHWEGGSLSRFLGDDYHPVQDVTCGEFLVKKIYEAVTNSPKWDKTLLVITFDENGGTYDHFPPWEAVPSGREPKETQFGFAFDCYGVRVPTLLISKHIKPETVFRSPTAVPFDHTSIIATILKWQDIPKEKWRLGDRVHQAPTFDGVLDGSGQSDKVRLKHATGMRLFDSARKKRIDSGSLPLKYDDTVVYLRYIGNKWSPPAAPIYLGGPVSDMGWWYPYCTDKKNALKFKLVRPQIVGDVKAGDHLQIVVAEGKAAGYSLAMPESFKASTVYLYKGSILKPSQWVVWLVNDRTNGDPLFVDDEVIIFSERYLPEKLTLNYDPYQRLTVAPDPGGTKKRFVKWRAGEWDVWKIEKA